MNQATAGECESQSSTEPGPPDEIRLIRRDGKTVRVEPPQFRLLFPMVKGRLYVLSGVIRDLETLKQIKIRVVEEPAPEAGT